MMTHDIVETLFPADRLDMGSNSRAAAIGETLTIGLTRPSSQEEIEEDPRYEELCNQAIDYL